MKTHELPLASVLAFAMVGVLSAEVPVPSDWVGGFDREEESIFVRVRLSQKDGELQGTCDITGESLFPEMGKELRDVQSHDDHVRFVLKRKAGELSFDGRLTERRIEGKVTQNQTKANFQLTRIKPVDPSKYQGVYRYPTASRDNIAYIGRATIYEDFLFFLDYRTGAFDGLFPLSETTFFAGPSLLVTEPEKLRITCSLDAQKRAQSYTLRVPGRRDLSAERIRYKEVELGFKNGRTSLEGTLVSPKAGGPHPLIVFVPASTARATRDMSRVFAEYFAYHGVAGFIYDKRGTGTSKGNWLEAGFDVLAEDALAAVRMLQRRPEVDAKRIGLFGGSQGGWIVGLAASRSPAVSFIISQSGPGVTPERQELHRTEYWLRADGFDESDIEKALAYTRLRYECARTGKGWARVAEIDEHARNAAWSGYVGTGISPDNPFWTFFNLIRDYDPAPTLRNVKCPVLAIFGERDTFLPVEESVRVWRESLQKAGNGDVTIKVFPGAGHSLEGVETGGLKEMPRINHFVDGYFATMRDWVLERVAKN